MKTVSERLAEEYADKVLDGKEDATLKKMLIDCWLNGYFEHVTRWLEQKR